MTGIGLNAARIGLLLSPLLVFGCCNEAPKSGAVLDEAAVAKRDPASFPAAGEDYFHDMDRGEKLFQNLDPLLAGLDTKEAHARLVKGRNTWIVWTGGNDRFWDVMTIKTFGLFDLVKTISSHPSMSFGRHNRWGYLGVINEPCFEQAKGPDPKRFNLWLDTRRADCPPDPFADAGKYPGVALKARDGKIMPIGSYYGEPTGVVGLRLFPNPDFDEAAKSKWDAKRFYEDPNYYLQKDLVRPYRVGMSCGFCHVGPSAINPPADPENPKWENLSSVVGAQYFWFDRVIVWDAKHSENDFIFQMLHTQRPGSLDTSLVSTDNINNPRTMNAVYSLGARIEHARRWGKETLGKGSNAGAQYNKQFNDYIKDGPLTKLFQKPDTVWTPRVLKDGSDSVGGLGALNRVYINIGLFSEEWLLHFNPFLGGKPITPIEIAVAEKNSSFWKATENQTPDMALFLIQASAPDYLKLAPGGAAHLPKDEAAVDRGKTVFANTCARCHSSKLPTDVRVPGLDSEGCNGPNYLACWNKYWDWTKTDEFKQKMQAIVHDANFLERNYLSSELRVPATLLQTNACSPLATNALAGNIWDNFSSQSYKNLPSVGTIMVVDPFTGLERPYNMPAGGRGYTRPASLASLWSTAPYLLNNTVGPLDPDRPDQDGMKAYNPNPSVETRMKNFNISIEQMLWPEKRARDPIFTTPGPGTGLIDRTTTRSYLKAPVGYLPPEFYRLRSVLHRLAPNVFAAGGSIQLGPIPAGTPVGVLANLQLLAETDDPVEKAAHIDKMVETLILLKHNLEKLPADASDDDARKVFHNLSQKLLSLSKCPDFVVNKGHYFGTNFFAEEAPLNDDQKKDLIEFLKTM
jgi:hypothetical protein